jgi:hypothetical protein
VLQLLLLMVVVVVVLGCGFWVVVVLHTFHSFISHRPMALQYSVR